MKARSFLVPLCAAILIVSCQSNENKSTTTEQPTDSAATVTDMPVDPDPTDTIPAEGYAAYNSNMQTAEMIKKSLTDDILKNDLAVIPAEQRKFKYHAVDLNNDNTDEYFVTSVGPYFCGSGGCTAFLLDHEGKLLTRFTVTDFPIHVAASMTDGWKDLIITSKGVNHLIKMKGGKYPSNPSVEPEYKGDTPNMSPAILNVFDAAYPAFTY